LQSIKVVALSTPAEELYTAQPGRTLVYHKGFNTTTLYYSNA